MKILEILNRKVNLKKWLIRGTLLFAVAVILTFTGLITWVNYEARTFATNAAEEFQTEKAEALLAVIDSKNHSIKEKNKAIWTLGVLKEKEALPKLETIYTGEECNHDSEICQYEIKKAIRKIKGEFNGSWQVSK